MPQINQYPTPSLPLTGSEQTAWVQTQNGSGVTVSPTVAQVLAAGYSLQAPAAGFSITVPTHCTGLFLNPGATLASGTVTMEATPEDGQRLTITSTQTVTTFTLAAATGQTVLGGVTTLTALTPVRYRYIGQIKTWIPD